METVNTAPESVNPPRRRRRGLAVAAVVGLAAVGVAPIASAAPTDRGHHGAPTVPAPPANPTRADQIQNIDQVRTSIKGYYGDVATDTQAPGGAAGVTLHQYDPRGAYAKEAAGVVHSLSSYLNRHAASDERSHATSKAAAKRGHGKHAKPAIVLDVDDTSLVTYSYEIFSNFAYSTTTNSPFVDAGSADVFPATPGMDSAVRRAKAKGYTVFFLTGRPEAQREGTEANLEDAGYPVTTKQVYLKDQSAAWLSSCAPDCTTIEYKSLTRAHIEDQGYDIVANVGDQYSDLKGGYANRTFKLPNPMYYLP